jgi:hypothetical protein
MPRMSTYLKRMRTAKHITRVRAKRPKTFKSEEAAKRYVEAQSIKSYKLVDVSAIPSKTKIMIMQE